MAKKTLKANLSVSSIRQLQKELEKYKADIIYKCQLLAEKLAERGVEIARVRVAELDAIFTGELIQSLHSEYGESTKTGAIFYIVTDSQHAAFVEFGTLGNIGGKAEYPYPFPDGIEWNYGSGKHIIQLSNGEYGWFYKGDDGKVYWSSGMSARPFMYQTSMQLYQEVEKIAKEVFRK